MGEHDFRNFCKIDVQNVNNFRRRILSFTVDRIGGHPPRCQHSEREGEGEGEGEVEGGDECLCSSLWAFTIRGYAFLWHQVRCMVAVLFLIGNGLESPNIVTTLLDIERTPRKPSYEMASELPLVLFHCSFPQLAWYMNESTERVRESLRSDLETHFLQTAIHYAMASALDAEMEKMKERRGGGEEEGGVGRGRGRGEKGRKYVQLMERAVEPSVEERVRSLPSRKRKRYEEKFAQKAEMKEKMDDDGESEGEGGE